MKMGIRSLVETLKTDFPKWYCPSSDWNYKIALFGSAVTAISLAFRNCISTKLTAEWFSQSEHDTVNSLASLADVFGVTLVFLMVPLVAKDPSDLLFLQVYIGIPIILSFIGSLFIHLCAD